MSLTGSGAALAVRLLPKYLGLEERPTRARELLRRIARSEAWLVDEEELAERAEAWEEPFLRRVRNELSALYEVQPTLILYTMAYTDG